MNQAPGLLQSGEATPASVSQDPTLQAKHAPPSLSTQARTYHVSPLLLQQRTKKRSHRARAVFLMSTSFKSSAAFPLDCTEDLTSATSWALMRCQDWWRYFFLHCSQVRPRNEVSSRPIPQITHSLRLYVWACFPLKLQRSKAPPSARGGCSGGVSASSSAPAVNWALALPLQQHILSPTGLPAAFLTH